jgi:hypothetical protein
MAAETKQVPTPPRKEVWLGIIGGVAAAIVVLVIGVGVLLQLT